MKICIIQSIFLNVVTLGQSCFFNRGRVVCSFETCSFKTTYQYYFARLIHIFSKQVTIYIDHVDVAIVIRAIASLTVPGGQEFHFPHFFLKSRLSFLIFPQTFTHFLPHFGPPGG